MNDAGIFRGVIPMNSKRTKIHCPRFRKAKLVYRGGNFKQGELRSPCLIFYANLSVMDDLHNPQDRTKNMVQLIRMLHFSKFLNLNSEQRFLSENFTKEFLRKELNQFYCLAFITLLA